MAQLRRHHLIMGMLMTIAVASALSTSAEPREDFELDYALYYLADDGPAVDVVVALHTFDCLDDAMGAIASSTDLEPREAREGILDINATLGVAILSTKNPGGGWVPNAHGSAWLFVTADGLPQSLDYAFSNRDGSQLKWKVLLDNQGLGHTLVGMPDTRGVYWFVPDVASLYYPSDYARMEEEKARLDISEVDREIDLEYVVWSLFDRWDGTELLMFAHTFPDDREALAFLEEVEGATWDFPSGERSVSSGSRVTMSYASTVRTISYTTTRGPNSLGNVRVRLVEKGASGMEPLPLKAADGTFLKWEGSMDVQGRGNISLVIPPGRGVCKVHVQVAGGLGDSVFVLMENESRDLGIVAPPAFALLDLSTYPAPTEPGEPFNVMGRVVLRYNGGTAGVPGVQVTAGGPQVATGLASSDGDGHFSIQLQAPSSGGGTMSLYLGVVDPSKGVELHENMAFDVRTEAEADSSSLPTRFLYVVIVAVLGLSAIAGVAVSIIRNDRS